MFEGHESSFLNERNIVILFHKTLVHQFYQRDDVSRMCHGKKDYLSIKDPDTGKREHKQKRLLYLTLSIVNYLAAIFKSQ